MLLRQMAAKLARKRCTDMDYGASLLDLFIVNR
jgi:hypothetical protein